MRRLAIASAGLLLLLLGGWLVSSEEPVSPGLERSPAGVPARVDAPPPVAAPTGARIAGLVVRGEEPVARARVTLRGAGVLVALTLDDGRFLFDDVPSGAVYLSASTADAASDVLGPLRVLPKGELEGVVLRLAPAVSVEARLVDLLTRKPIAGATVVTPAHTGVTDADGRFVLRAARAQTWVELIAPGYLGRTEWIGLELARAGGRLDVVMTPASRLEGVVTEGGTPVAAATVWAEQLDGAQRGERGLTVFTDKQGRFRLETAAGMLKLSAVTPAGTRVKGPQLRVAVGESVTGLALEAGVVASAHGVVTRGGKAVAGAQVSAIDAATEDLSAVATSMPDGTFRFDALAEGRYVVQVRAGALTTIGGPFTQQADGQAWLVSLDEGAALEGRVEPATAGVRVRWRAGTWAGPSAETVTDAAGAFRFEGLPAEWVSLEADGPAGGATARARPGEAVVLRLEKATVTVRLRDDTNQPVTDGVVLARSQDTGASRRQLVLAPDGVARLELPPGTWLLGLEVAGRGRSADVAVQVRPEGADVTLTLETSVAVSGRVVDATSQLPMQGVRVEASSGEWGRATRVSVLTDARGEFLLPPVPRSASVSAWRSGYVAKWRRVADGGRWDVALQPTDDPRARNDGLPQFEGVGMTLDGRTGNVLVVQVNEGSPAERAGVQPGDQLLAVDGEAVAGQRLDHIVNRVRGPAGSPVVLRFRRGGQDFELTLRRRLLTL